MHALFEHVLATARQLKSSDIHLKAGMPPVFRLRGQLCAVRNVPVLTGEVIAAFAEELMTDVQRHAFGRDHDVDLAYGDAAGSRYRINIYRQRGAVGMALRVVPPGIPSFESLNLPEVVLRLAEEERGMILVTGTTGSGKSTTLAAMIDYTNSRSACHILTIEDPIEYLHRDKKSIINQRELGQDTPSFARALRAALRQDPDVILVGEMRDRETIDTALTAAETGHLVMSTLHTVDAVETINRIIVAFPADQQEAVRLQLSTILRGIISQRLVPRADGKGMVPAVEVMIASQRVRELMADPKRTVEIHEAIAQGRNPYGMMSFDQSLAELVHNRLVTYEVALAHATRPDDFALSFRGFQSGIANQLPNLAQQPAPQSETTRQHDAFKVDRFQKE